MEPKDKAKELVEKMFNVDLDCENEAMCMLYPHAIRCALIAVDEIIKSSPQEPRSYTDTMLYWEEVKQEIEKI